MLLGGGGGGGGFKESKNAGAVLALPAELPEPIFIHVQTKL